MQSYLVVFIGYLTMYLIRKNFNIAQNDMISTYGLSMTQLGMIGLGFSITYGVGKTLVSYYADGKNTKQFLPFMLNKQNSRVRTNRTMKKILLVDDKVTIGRVLKIYLGTEYDLEYFEDPIKALEWLNEGNLPDLIISDIRMPHMRGNEFLYYLKGNELLKHIPVVMLSSEESTTERIHLLEAGAADYILKPFNPLELRARIKKYI